GREQRPPQQGREQRPPQQQQSREQRAQPNRDGRDRQHSNSRSGARVEAGGAQQPQGQGAPRLQMASARANIASQSGAEPHNNGSRPDNFAHGNAGSRPNGGGRPNYGNRPNGNDAGRANGGGRPSHGNRPNGNDASRANGGGRPNQGNRPNGGNADRNAARRPARGPEVIVLTRRAPEGSSNHVRIEPQAGPPAGTEGTDHDTRRQRRR
ncbi:MAG: hypothetical protein ABJB12_15340, partial [Pseudomonadota bacterium]